MKMNEKGSGRMYAYVRFRALMAAYYAFEGSIAQRKYEIVVGLVG